MRPRGVATALGLGLSVALLVVACGTSGPKDEAHPSDVGAGGHGTGGSSAGLGGKTSSLGGSAGTAGKGTGGKSGAGGSSAAGGSAGVGGTTGGAGGSTGGVAGASAGHAGQNAGGQGGHNAGGQNAGGQGGQNAGGQNAGGQGGQNAGGQNAGGQAAGGQGGQNFGGFDGTGGAAPVWTCNQDLAYWATSSITFDDPTPAPLASALKSISLTGHPISFVLHGAASTPQAGLSATITGSAGKDVFPPGEAPALGDAVMAFGLPPGITTLDPQPAAYLHFVDQKGPVELPIEHIVWRATEGASCADVTVDVQAIVSAAQFGIVLHLSNGDHTIGELVAGDFPDAGPDDSGIVVEDAAGSSDGGAGMTKVALHFSFQGAPMMFDFSTL